MRSIPIVCCIVLLSACAIRPQPADIVLTNGVIWTGAEDQKPQQALAMRNGRVIDVGSNEAIRKFVMSGTREVDLHGRLVVPGFIDNHTHFMSGGYQLVHADSSAAAPTHAERDEAFRRAQAYALARGVTMVTDMGTFDDLLTYRRAHAAGDLKLRIYAYVPLAAWDRLRDYIARQGSGDSRLKWGGVEGFVDGSLGATTAWFFQPYADAPETSGGIVTDTADLRNMITNADRAGLQVAIQAVGDRANKWTLDTYADVMRKGGRRDRRFRIEHAQSVLPADIARFAQLGVIPSMQPYHVMDEGRLAEKRMGMVRIRTAYAFRSLLDAGAKVTFGSDWPAAPIDPLEGIYAAVTRRSLDGKSPDGWVREEKITVEEALRAYAVNNASAAFMERDLGAIARGRRADMVVLSENILEGDPANIPGTRIDYTIVQGQIVYARPTAARALARALPSAPAQRQSKLAAKQALHIARR